MRRAGALFVRPSAAALALSAMIAAALGLRLWAIDHGLPFVFNPDEELHFVPVAVDMLGGSLNPGYFENPPGLTYLLLVLFKLRFLAGFPFGDGEFARAFASDPTAAYITARVAVALLGTLAVGLVFWAGARFADRRAGLVAAGILTFAFLPVLYSKQALNDVVTLVPITVALVGCLLALERGGTRDWVLAGAATGVATATKYTAGAMLATVVLVALLRLHAREDRMRAATAGLAAALAAFAAAFLALNPYALLDAPEFLSQVRGQSSQAGGAAKLGQADVPGWIYYGWTLTWGLGLLPALAAVAGAVVVLRRDGGRGLLLVAFPVILFVFLGAQARWFGRWLLPAYPMLAILAGIAAVRAADALSRGRGVAWRAGAVTLLAVALMGQGALASVRVNMVLGREDTRTQARAWLLRHVPADAKIVVEPFLPAGFLTTGGRTAPLRYRSYPVRRPFQTYERRVSPALVERYRRAGYCWVVTGSHQKQRGLAAGLPAARRYYRRLTASSDAVITFSPFEPGADRPPFNFDLSFNHLPPAFERPGPLIEIHRLRDCPSTAGGPV